MTGIHTLPKSDRPREKLSARGADALSDVELLAIVLGCGTQQHDVLSLSRQILAIVDSRNGNLGLNDLMAVPGIGSGKAAQILAMLEFTRRRIKPEGIKIREPKDVLPLLSHLADRKQEHFVCLSLNGAHEVIATRIVTVGLVNATQVHPREVFSDPIVDRACAVIVAHNHPSGELKASKEDLEVTKVLQGAAGTLGIKLLDHVIFSRRGYFSFQEEGLL